MTVAGTDERFEEPGVAGVTVRVEGARFTEEVVSDEEGAFKMSVPMKETDRVDVIVSGEGIQRGSGRVYLPRTGQRLLVVVDRD